MARTDLPLDGGLSIALTGKYGLRVLRKAPDGRATYLTPPTLLTTAELWLLGDALKRFASQHQGDAPSAVGLEHVDEPVEGRELQSVLVQTWVGL